MTIGSRDTGLSTPSHEGVLATRDDAPVAVPSVWAVVSAYLHSGTAASEAAPESIRGSAPERVAQVRGLFEQALPSAPTPTVERGSTRDALRNLFSRVEGLDPAPAPVEDETEVIDLRDHRVGDSRPHRERRSGHDHREPAEIDLRDGHDAPHERRVQQYATMRRDSVDDAVVRWYTMRHRQHSHSGF